MLAQLRKRLECAEGRSEFVIAVICDIRGFSEFSKGLESPDTAMFIKRFYLKLLNDYFPKARFAKPTGDGLLLVYGYSEYNLPEVTDAVLQGCENALKDFPTMFAADPMINFEVPSSLGFGISRGPACCLFAGQTIIDYSGRVLNLAARLNDLARPKGIVIDGKYMKEMIPQTFAKKLKSDSVFLRGVAERDSIEVFFSSSVVIPDRAHAPIGDDNWKKIEHRMTLRELKKIKASMSLSIASEPLGKDKSRLHVIWLDRKLAGYSTQNSLTNYSIHKEVDGSIVIIPPKAVSEVITKAGEAGLISTSEITFRFQYVSK